ncbi:MAG: DNA polymerase III subunit alpha [Actinobacteria bacterium]|nr:DNA polymerase III subunit alpha [Actinomycetota bacterium]
MSFPHLQVASGFSFKYGAILPEELVVAAKNQGLTRLALTDRDEIGGAVRFIKSCIQYEISPILGIDLAISPSGALRKTNPSTKLKSPTKGGSYRDKKHYRAVLLARGKFGWSALVNLSTKIGSARFSDPNSTLSIFDISASLKQLMPNGYTSADSALVVVLTPQSEFAAAVLGRRPDIAIGIIKQWRDTVGVTPVIAVTSHQSQQGEFSTNAARKLLKFADEHGLKSVLVNSVRYLTEKDGYIADVLDAVRGLIPIHPKHISQSTSSAYLKNTDQMAQIAIEITQNQARANQLLLDTELLAASCSLNPVTDLAWGHIYLPELDLLTSELTIKNTIQHNPGDAMRAQALLRTKATSALEQLGLDRNLAAVARLEQELAVVASLGFAAYFLAVAKIVVDVKELGSRVNVRGSAGGSFLVYLLGISLINPLEHGLLMERFLSPNRRSLPDIDIDVESDRRLDVYHSVLDKFSSQRVAAVAMIDTYRVRHAIRDVGAALMFSPGEISALATAFPHIRARDVRSALADLPELRKSSITNLANLDQLFDCVIALDALPRHRAMHPCGVIISDASLATRVPILPGIQDFPVTVFDKDDVEDLGLIKLDILGVRMQSAIRHTLNQVKQVYEIEVEIDHVPHNDLGTFELIQSTKTLGCFQIESPGQRELVGKLAPKSMHDLIVDISLFRPGPIKSDMITPFLAGKHGWQQPRYLHTDLIKVLSETWGVIVFHEQVMKIFSIMTGCSLADADEYRRALGAADTQFQVREIFYRKALGKGYELSVVDQVWQELKSFGSFGFCKAHAAAFALPTYQSAWLKTHYPAAFISGVLTHDPGMYPKRLILDEARNLGISILPLDVNLSKLDYQVEVVLNDLSTNSKKYGIRMALSDISGVSELEISNITAGQPYSSLSDFWQRAQVSRPTAENLIKLGAFNQLYSSANSNNRDLLLQLADLVKLTDKKVASGQLSIPVNSKATNQSTGLPEVSKAEKVKTELNLLGMDVTAHALSFYYDFLAKLSAEVKLVSSANLRKQRSGSVAYTAGVKVAIQTPPVRSGNRVAFLTLDDGSGPIDLAFFEAVQQDYADVIFNSWLVLTAGIVKKSGPNGISIRGLGCWELQMLYQIAHSEGINQVSDYLKTQVKQQLVQEKMNFKKLDTTSDRVRRRTGGMGPAKRLLLHASGLAISPYSDIKPAGTPMNTSIISDSGLDFAIDDAQLPTKLWHKSPGSGGR